MRFQATIVAFAASLALTGAQDLSSVPQCALPCLIQSVPSSGCTATDIKCQCTTGQSKLTDSLTQCIPKACSAEDAAKVEPALLQICKSAGITVSVPASVASAAASAAGSSAGSAVASATSAAASKASTSASASASKASGSSAPEASKAAAPANMAGLGAVAMGLAVFAL